MRIAFSLLVMIALIFSNFSMAQRDRPTEFYEDKELFETGGGRADGNICMHVTSVVGSVPLLWNVESNFTDLFQNEISVEILAEGHEQRIVQAASIALERHGFVRVEEDVYELPESSLCFLKIYQSESPKLITFIPFFQNPLDRCDAVFTAQYEPVAFEQTLVEEFAQFKLLEHIEFRRTIRLFHPPPRLEVDTCD